MLKLNVKGIKKTSNMSKLNSIMMNQYPAKLSFQSNNFCNKSFFNVQNLHFILLSTFTRPLKNDPFKNVNENFVMVHILFIGCSVWII